MTFQLEIEGKFCGVAYSQFFCWKKLSSSTKKSSDGQNCLLSSAMSCRRRFPINVLDSMESTTSFLLMQNALGGSVLSQELHRRHLAWALPFLLSADLPRERPRPLQNQLVRCSRTEQPQRLRSSSSVRVRTFSRSHVCVFNVCVWICIDFLLISDWCVKLWEICTPSIRECGVEITVNCSLKRRLKMQSQVGLPLVYNKNSGSSSGLYNLRSGVIQRGSYYEYDQFR